MRFSLPLFSGVGDLDEIVFEHRNKGYGAYELRQHYNDRLQKALLIVVSSLTLFAVLIFYLQNRKPPEIKNEGGWIFKMDSVKTFTVEKTHPKPQPPPPPPPQASIEKLPVDVVNDSTILNHQQVVTASVSNFKPGDLSSSAGNNLSNEVSSGTGSDGTADGNVTQTQIKDPNEVILLPEVMPSFPGGSKELSKYLMRNFDCDGSNLNGSSQEGKIILKFVVMRDGTIKDMTVMRETVSIDCVERLKEVFEKGPKWNPGLQNNQPVNVMVVQPITFMVQ